MRISTCKPSRQSPEKKVKYSVLLALFAALCLNGCNLVLEEDIQNRQVMLLTPVDSSISTKFTQIFRWEAIPEARTYQVQIASPTLDKPGTFFVDTTLKQPTFRITLPPGRFQWQVRAVNAGYKTQFFTRTFRLDTTSNLAVQDFLLTNPTDGQVLNDRNVVFRWEALPVADKYIFELLDPVRKDTLLANSTAINFPDQERSYSWRVTALNRSSRKTSPIFQFSLRNKVPPPTAAQSPTLLNPAEGATFLQGQPISLSWQRNITDIRNDSLFLYGSNQTTLLINPVSVTGSVYTLTGNNPVLGSGTYYWAVKSVNTAGQASPLSAKRSFRVF
jgi:hypothetical protein